MLALEFTDNSFPAGESCVHCPVLQAKDTHGKERHSSVEETEKERRKWPRLEEEQS